MSNRINRLRLLEFSQRVWMSAYKESKRYYSDMLCKQYTYLNKVMSACLGLFASIEGSYADIEVLEAYNKLVNLLKLKNNYL